MKTVMANAKTVKREWWVVDAADMPLGRVASQVAAVLRGKTKPDYTPHFDNGDYVIVINTDKMILTGNKLNDKFYYRHSGFPGGFKEISFKAMMEKVPTRAIEKAVKGMLPHNTLGDEQFQKLKVYAGSEHPHAAQKPVVYELKGDK